MRNSPNKNVWAIRGILLWFTVAACYLVAIMNTRDLMLELKAKQATSPSAQNQNQPKDPLETSSEEFRPTTKFPDSFFREPLLNATPQQPVTMVVQLSGELGNHMNQITVALCFKYHIEKNLGLKSELKFRAQNAPKWKRAMTWTKQAFPNMRPFDFRAANTKEFDQVRMLQDQWLQSLIMSKQLNLTGVEDPTVLNLFHKGSKMEDVLVLLNQTMYMKRPSPTSNNFSIPHIYLSGRGGLDCEECIEMLGDDLMDFFAFDEETNCRQVPDPDESVLHLRNFMVEVRDKASQKKGYEELSPNRTALEIFADYKPGDKVAIISRFEENTDKYIHALRTLKGIDARYIKGQTGNQDFCFLMKTQQEIIATGRSTFGKWASILSNAKKARLYSIDHTGAVGGNFSIAAFPVRQLRDRIVIEVYKAQD
eukprot:scaffold4075_cov63-Cylindrotheca_fusiformis.AAC.4